ncbi:acetyltransferase [Staphylococcus pragensis]|uniref:Acetyltransferase n=1 Tax=Staphylococcus pragensis TaxID=1611836 RepID=A0A4Z1BL93_9STAP|nr:acetyltransferase [Staphylococcus pragensis]RTX89663.1 acetyltransferase [Staphylococcus carnosus]TGN24662.1 acetyltransferase [Staphylococcus pragensis]GGG95833.1 putative acetyltransferase EpsM [Staphylococcus pragensis]
MKKVILIGNGGHSKVIADIIKLSDDCKLCGYLDQKFEHKEVSNGLIYDSISNFKKYVKEYHFFIAIGNNKIRKKIYETLNLPKEKYVTLIHPSVVIGSDVHIGHGTVVMGNAVINASTNIGNQCIINTLASVGHDININDFVHISPNSTLTGGSIINEGTQIGAGACLIPCIQIGKNCLVGAGATVVNNVPDNKLVVGSPAKVKKEI